MSTIQNMATRVNTTIEGIGEKNKPDSIEVEFGLKFDGELDVVIAKARSRSKYCCNSELGFKKGNK